MINAVTLGLDYGTNSVRALLVRCRDGKEISSAVVPYKSGEAGILVDRRDPNLARQHPGDYLDGAERAVRLALKAAKKKRGFKPEHVIGIGVDSTGSTPLPVDRNNRPLALAPKWKRNLAAQAWLWKDHTAAQEAQEITELARREFPEYVRATGGTYSSEWFWAKIWRCLRAAPRWAS